MKKIPGLFLILLIVLNSMVLLGQLWPAASPPFARKVNMLTIILNLLLLVILYTKRKK